MPLDNTRSHEIVAREVAQLTLEDVRAAITDDEALTSTQRRDMLWALGRIGHRLKTPLAQLSADDHLLDTVRHAFRADPDRLSSNSVANVLSRLRSVLARYAMKAPAAADQTPAPPKYKDTLPPASAVWTALLSQLPPTILHFRLQTLARWATGHGIEPDAVCVRTFHAYEAERCPTLKAPGPHMRSLRKEWNAAAMVVAGWPQIVPPEPVKKMPFTVAETDLAPELRAALHAHYDARQAAGERRGGRRPRPDPQGSGRSGSPFAMRAESARKSMANVRIFLGALRSLGQDIATITTLAKLCDYDRVDQGIAVLEGRTRVKDTGSQAYNVAATLCALAHHTGMDDAVVNVLRALRKDVRPIYDGMVEARRRELEPFRSPALQKRLYELPYRLATEAYRTGGHRGALLMQSAVAIELLLVSAMRIRNIATLHLDKHFTDVGTGKDRRLTIFVRPDQVKNSVSRQKRLAPETVDLLDAYLADFRPDLATDGDHHLFPGASRDGGKSVHGLGQQIIKAIRQHLGHHLCPHSFRALAVLLYLKDNPGGFEVMSHVLGHKGLTTLLKHYRWAEVEQSFEAYQAVVSGSRNITTQVRAIRQQRGSATARSGRRS